MNRIKTIRISLFIFILLICAFCTTNQKNYSYSKFWTESDRNFLLENLDSTLILVLNEVSGMNEAEWIWKSDTTTWSVAEIVEHLITHDELFFRELQVLTSLPEVSAVADSLFSTDEIILGYREITPQNIGKAPVYLEPLGRWCSMREAVTAYSRIRNALIEKVKSTSVDLRKYYTASGRGPTQYRDLHQLLLISIAHTTRHYRQIVKTKKNYDNSFLAQ